MAREARGGNERLSRPASKRPSRPRAESRPERKKRASNADAAPRNRRRKRAEPEVEESVPVATEPARPRVRLAERMARLWAILRRPVFVLARVAAVVVALVGAVAVGRLVQGHLRTSAAFAIDTIELSGEQRLTREELLEVAGLELGANIFDSPPDQVEGRLMAHPWVSTAQVSRRLPNRFEITVREHKAVALLVVEACSEHAASLGDDACEDGPASSLYLVGEEGSVFKRMEGEDPVDMPVITGMDRQRFGTDPEYASSILLEAVALLHEYRAAGLWRRLPIAEIHVEYDGGFSLYVGTELAHIRLGLPPFRKKLRRMRKVFDRLDRERAQPAYVYLDNERRPDRVTVRLR